MDSEQKTLTNFTFGVPSTAYTQRERPIVSVRAYRIMYTRSLTAFGLFSPHIRDRTSCMRTYGTRKYVRAIEVSHTQLTNMSFDDATAI